MENLQRIAMKVNKMPLQEAGSEGVALSWLIRMTALG